MKTYPKLYALGLVTLLLSACSASNSETLSSKPNDSSTTTDSTIGHSISTVESTFITSASDMDVSEKSKEDELFTAESLMSDYPAWDIESGETPAEYNMARKNEANRRLNVNGLPSDDDFINRNPVILTREDEKEVRRRAGHLDYIQDEANIVTFGTMVIE